MLIDKLRNYYGFPNNEQVEYISKNVLGITEAEQDALADKIIEERSKRYGFPDIAFLSKYLKGAQKKTRIFYWSVCDDCGAEFDYGFMRCPACHLKGKQSSGYKVKTSENPPPRNVIRWNLTTFNVQDGYTNCVVCEHRDTGFCRWFGNPNHTCAQNDYEYCECKACCAKHRKANANLLKE